MKYEVTNANDLQQLTESEKSYVKNPSPQNRWVMSSNLVELKREFAQPYVQPEEEMSAEKTASFNDLPLRRKSWIPWPKF